MWGIVQCHQSRTNSAHSRPLCATLQCHFDFDLGSWSKCTLGCRVTRSSTQRYVDWFCFIPLQKFKDVVSEAEIPPKIGQLIRERIYAKEATARLFIAGWIIHLTGNPNAGFGEVLPAIIDGLFRALDDKQANVQRLVANALQGNIRVCNNN